ncbi:MAG: hypothetical protein LUH07_14495 [Lachnospiraceae bacterium]|nr:hypothetical protein [Lachnospiraceae bacterium]
MADKTLLERKQDNLMRALNREGADYVPTMLAASCAMVGWEGKKVTEIIQNPEEYTKAMTDVFQIMWGDGNTFTGTLFSPRIEEVLEPLQNKFGPDGVTPEHVQLPMMERNEYDELIADPKRFVFEVLLPRKYPRMYEDREYAKNALKVVTEDKFYCLAYLMGMQSKVLSEQYGITDIANFGEVFSNPVDTIFDYFRGFKGTLTDLRRQPDKVKAACDKLWEVYNTPKLASIPAKFPYACHMTHIAPYLSPNQFAEIYWPYEKQWIERAAAAGTKVWIMLEGSWEKVWHHFLEVPKDSCILHIDDDDICKAKQELGHHQIIEGGLKMATVRTGNIDKIKEDLKHVIDVCAPGDGFLFCTDKAWIAPGDVNQNLIDAYNFVHEYSMKK